MQVDLALWGRLLPLLEQALDQPAAERDAWLQAQALEAPLETALRGLLAERERIAEGSFLSALPPIAPPLPAAAWQAGQAVGRYRLLRELGRGGMSVVWLAEQDDGEVRRTVAMKFPHPGPDQHLLADRLRRERGILAALEHRHIARLYDVGATADGVPFLVMEHVPGRTLLEWCDERRSTVEQRLRLFLQVLGAVRHAHGLLVLHRDLKPSNILVTDDGEAKLLDFGIAKLMSGDTAEATALTRHGGRMLTPDYAAPEQITGAPVGTACDVYALGVVLFELLTGERPYRLTRRSAAALEEAILSAEPRRPSQVWQAGAAADRWSSTAPRLVRLLRGDLDLIVQTALRKDPAQRYPTVHAFEQDLRRWLAQEPIAARPASGWTRLKLFTARHRLAVGATAAVVLALGTGLGVALWQAGQARLEAAKAGAVKDYLLSLFESNSVEQADSLKKRQQSVQSLLEDGARSLHTGLAGQPAVRDEMQSVVGRLLHELGISQAAVDLRRRRLALLTAEDAAPALRVSAAHELADSLVQRGEAEQADRVRDEALQLCPPPAAGGPIECLSLQVARALRDVRENRLAEAAQRIEPVVQALERQAAGSANLAAGWVALGALRARQNRSADAQALFQQAAALRARLWGEGSTRLARSRYELAMDLWAERRHALAEAELVAAQQVFAQGLGPEHPTTALAQLQLARLRSWIWGTGSGELERASRVIVAHADQLDPERVFEARLVVLENQLTDGRLAAAAATLAELRATPPTSADLVDAFNFAEVTFLQSTGDIEAARDRLRRRREALASRFEAHHPYVADIDFWLARLDVIENRFADARAGFDRVIASQPAGDAPSGSIRHRAAVGLARVAIDEGRFAEALALMQALHDEAHRKPRPEQAVGTLIDVDARLGQVLCGLGRHGEGRPLLERAAQAVQARYAGSPFLAVLRAHLAGCLAGAGQKAEARRLMALADEVLQVEPLAGPQFRRTVDKVRRRLEAG